MLENGFPIDWFKVPSVFLDQLRKKGTFGDLPILYAGCEVVGSYSPTEEKL